MIFAPNGIVDRNVSRIFWEVDWFIAFLAALRTGSSGLFCEFTWKPNAAETIASIVKHWWSLQEKDRYKLPICISWEVCVMLFTEYLKL